MSLIEIPREYRVSHSEVESWLLCRRKHYYAYIKNIQRISHSVALNHGTIGHDLLRQMFEELSPDFNMDAFLQVKIAELMREGELGTDSLATLARQFKAFSNINPFRGYKVLAIEKEFVVKISETLYYPFVVDLIVKRESDQKIIIVDHKFTKDFYGDRDLELLPQIPKYIAAIRLAGKPADGGAYSMFRTGYAKSSDVPDEKVYQFKPIDISEKRIETSMEEQLEAAFQIQEVKKLDPEEQDRQALRVANKLICNSCSFHSICSAELNGHASELLLRSEYKVKEDRVFTVESGDE